MQSRSPFGLRPMYRHVIWVSLMVVPKDWVNLRVAKLRAKLNQIAKPTENWTEKFVKTNTVQRQQQIYRLNQFCKMPQCLPWLTNASGPGLIILVTEYELKVSTEVLLVLDQNKTSLGYPLLESSERQNVKIIRKVISTQVVYRITRSKLI